MRMRLPRLIPALIRGVRAPKRAARSRGFGIHSPFAFRFVREVLSQPYAYYSYPQLDRAAKAEGCQPAVVRTLFRLSLWFRPGAVDVVGSASEAVSLAIRRGNPQTQTAGMPPKCIVGLGDGREKVSGMWRQSERGMLFRAKEMAIFVTSDHLPHQKFDILLS